MNEEHLNQQFTKEEIEYAEMMGIDMGKEKDKTVITEPTTLEVLEDKSLFELYCSRYSSLNKEIDTLKLEEEEETKSIKEQINELQNKINAIKSEKYTEKLNLLNQEKESVKVSILEEFPKEEKTVNFKFGKFTKATLTGIEIIDKEVLISELDKKGLLNHAIKSFDEGKIKTWINADIELLGAKIKENDSLKFTAKKEV